MNTFRVPREIVDYMHAKTHLYDSLSKPSEKRTGRLETWVDTTETPLYNGETSKVVARSIKTQS